MKNLLFVVFILFNVRVAYSQCSTSGTNPSTTVSGSSSCGGCTQSFTTAGSPYTPSMTSSVNDVYCVAAGETVTFSTLQWTLGTLRVCGTLNITSLSVGFPGGGSNFARIIVERTGTLNIANAFSLQQYTGITNYGTLNFDNTGSPIVLNNDAYVYTAHKWAKTYFDGGITTNATANLINMGKMYISGTATINSGAGSWCLERSYTEVVNLINSATNGISFSSASDAASTAVINFTGTQTLNNNLSGSAIKYCRNGAGSNPPSPANYGSGVYSSTACASVVPVVWGALTATKKQSSNNIKWTTLQEFNNDYFILEKSSDGVIFESISKIKGVGNSNIPLSYNVEDYGLNEGVTYYRIKQIDKNGDFEYSEIFTVSDEYSRGFLIYPNPVDNSLTQLFLENHSNDHIYVTVYSDLGQIISSGDVKVSEGEVVDVFAGLHNLSSGMYEVKITTNSNVHIEKIVIQ